MLNQNIAVAPAPRKAAKSKEANLAFFLIFRNWILVRPSKFLQKN
jgi:hypothetical protein